MLDFDIQSQGLSKVLNTSKPLSLEWNLKTYTNEKSTSYENRYSELYFEHKDGKAIIGLGTMRLISLMTYLILLINTLLPLFY
jgi:YidC/Oxa1 family membrane protein insertase